jgi:predicted transcriptional regulator of viral defense system
MKLDTFFAKNMVFTVEEIDVYLHSQDRDNQQTREALLAYHIKRGRIVRIRRGLYATIPSGGSADTFPVDPLLVASRLTDDAALAYHTALEFHGIAQSLYSVHTVLSSKRFVRNVMFQGTEYKAIRTSTALRRSGQENVGVETRERASLPVRVTGFERTLVDCLDRPDLAGGWEEVWRSFQDAGHLDSALVADIAIAMCNDTLAAKVGWFLEMNADNLLINPDGTERLRQHRPHQARYVDRYIDEPQFLPEWNLIVPVAVTNLGKEEAA